MVGIVAHQSMNIFFYNAGPQSVWWPPVNISFLAPDWHRVRNWSFAHVLNEAGRKTNLEADLMRNMHAFNIPKLRMIQVRDYDLYYIWMCSKQMKLIHICATLCNKNTHTSGLFSLYQACSLLGPLKLRQPNGHEPMQALSPENLIIHAILIQIPSWPSENE